MLPPLLLDIKKDDLILDMCASPGSKTMQMIEMLFANNEANECIKGGVVANDADE